MVQNKIAEAHPEICGRLSHDGEKSIEYDHGKAR